MYNIYVKHRGGYDMNYENDVDASVNKYNLSELSIAQSVNFERRICEIAELAYALAADIISLSGEGLFSP